jgi:hypothetical protein
VFVVVRFVSPLEHTERGRGWNAKRNKREERRTEDGERRGLVSSSFRLLLSPQLKMEERK